MLRRVVRMAALLLMAIAVNPGAAAAQSGDWYMVCWYQGRFNVDGVVQDGWYCIDTDGHEYLIAIRVQEPT